MAAKGKPKLDGSGRGRRANQGRGGCVKPNRRSIKGPVKGPASKMYHFNIVPKKYFGDFRVLKAGSFKHIYRPDYAHALERFAKKFGTRRLPKGTEIVVGRRKARAPKWKWSLGKKGEPRAWVIHKIIAPRSSRALVKRNQPVKRYTLSAGMAPNAGVRRYKIPPTLAPNAGVHRYRVPPALAPNVAPNGLWSWLWGEQESRTAVPVSLRGAYPIALVYETYAGQDPQSKAYMSRYWTYLAYAEGKSPEDAAKREVRALQYTIDIRRAHDQGIISVTVVWFDPTKKEFTPSLAYGRELPLSVLQRLIGMMGVTPDAGAPAGPAAPTTTEYMPAPPVQHISSIQEAMMRKGVPDGIVPPEMGPPRTPMGPAPAPAYTPGPVQTMAPGITPTTTVAPPALGQEEEEFSSWLEEKGEGYSSNPFLQLRQNQLRQNPHNIMLWGQVGDIGDITPPAAMMGVPDLPAPGDVTSPGDVVKEVAQIEQEFGDFIAAETAANRRRKKNPGKKKGLTGWKRKVNPIAKRLSSRYAAVAGYLLRSVMTKPKHIVDAKTVKGRVYIRLNGEKMFKPFEHLNRLGAWWEKLKVKAKLTKSEMSAADRVFTRMVVKGR